MANRKSPTALALNPAYGSWSAMHQRCRNPNRADYARYGALGVSICARWFSFMDFLADVGPKPSSTHQLDRFPDGAGNYEPGNVRWATPAEQARNRKSNKFYEVAGVRLCLKDWAIRTGLNPTVVRYRIRHGWPIERALTTPAYGRRA
jgi:hypothetical protein